MKFQPVIGLEVHAQLLTESKIFCGCNTRFGAPPNENTCAVCLGLPGSLPVLNRKAVELALKAALALHCEIPPVSIFARKNYFYPDLPKGYQISQYDRPLALGGRLEIFTGAPKTIRIKRLHLEEDAGKLLHEGIEESSASFVDMNRAGVPLIEIVTEPDLNSPEEAYAYLTGLKAILRYTEVSLANMEEGNLRCDANISLRFTGSGELGTKVEIKNLNSFKNVQRALEYEIGRQTEVLESGGSVLQETRLFDAEQGVTQSMRSKEEAHDYRYFPEPDLLPLSIEEAFLNRVRETIPELPAAKLARFVSQYQLPVTEARVIVEEKSRAERFEQTARLSRNPRQAANWILRDPEAELNPEHLAELIDLVEKGSISSDQAKTVFSQMKDTGKAPGKIVQEKGLTQITATDQLNRFIEEVFRQNPDLVERYRKGETKLLGVLVGQVMKSTGGKANPALVNQMIREKLQ